MIHKPDYVKELIKKYIEGAITSTEMERLKACWKIYEEDELLGMTASITCHRKAEPMLWKAGNRILQRSSAMRNAYSTIKKYCYTAKWQGLQACCCW